MGLGALGTIFRGGTDSGGPMPPWPDLSFLPLDLYGIIQTFRRFLDVSLMLVFLKTGFLGGRGVGRVRRAGRVEQGEGVVV